MVGNDIVDFKEAQHSSNWQRRGFLQKVFTAKEQEIIANATNAFTTVWHLWSLKESAYKVFIQAGGNRFFDPTKIECFIDYSSYNSLSGKVKIGNFNCSTTTSIRQDYIFSTATLNCIEVKTNIFKLPEENTQQQSMFMYEQILNDFAINNNLIRKALSLQKTSSGVPQIHYKSNPINHSISITHHGKYGAYSILEPTEELIK